MSIFSFIGHLFNSLFNSTKDAWEKLPATVQNSLINGQGILQIINEGANETPQTVAATILAEYPNQDATTIYTGLVSVAKSLNILPSSVPSDLEGLIAIIQPYLKSLEESTWPAIIQGAANVLAIALAPASTPFEVISTLAQFVYTNFIKPKTISWRVAQTPVAVASAVVNAVAPGTGFAFVANEVNAVTNPG